MGTSPMMPRPGPGKDVGEDPIALRLANAVALIISCIVIAYGLALLIG